MDGGVITLIDSNETLMYQSGRDAGYAEGLDAGNYCLRIDLNRNGQQMDEDEKINFIFNGDTMTIKQAKIQLKDMDKTPFG